MKAYIMCR